MLNSQVSHLLPWADNFYDGMRKLSGATHPRVTQGRISKFLTSPTTLGLKYKFI